MCQAARSFRFCISFTLHNDPQNRAYYPQSTDKETQVSMGKNFFFSNHTAMKYQNWRLNLVSTTLILAPSSLTSFLPFFFSKKS